MNQDVGFFARLMDEVSGGLEVETEVVILMVFPGDVESEGHCFFTVFNMNVFAGCEQ